MLGKIKDTRGYTRHEALWGDSWINMLMESADAMRYMKGRPPAPVIETKEDMERVLGKSRM